jgi:hypothetical protein
MKKSLDLSAKRAKTVQKNNLTRSIKGFGSENQNFTLKKQTKSLFESNELYIHERVLQLHGPIATGDSEGAHVSSDNKSNGGPGDTKQPQAMHNLHTLPRDVHAKSTASSAPAAPS